MNVLSTWMYSTPVGDDVVHYQVGSRSSDRRVRDIYWRCVFLLFESSSRQNGDTRHILFVNERPPERIDHVATSRLIEQYRIEIVELRRFTRPPKGYWGAWNTQFVVLDVLDWLSSNVAADDTIFVLDSDVILNRPIPATLTDAAEQHGALLYSLDFPPTHEINGLTYSDLLDISRDLGGPDSDERFVYSGGEFICATGREIQRIRDRARIAYELCLERHARGSKKFNEEAHLLSHVYRLLGYATHTGNAFIKRMWTDRAVHSNIDGTEDSLVFWHLPAEKRHGFVRVFRSYRLEGDTYCLRERDFAAAYRVSERLAQKPLRWGRQLARRTYRLVTP